MNRIASIPSLGADELQCPGTGHLHQLMGRAWERPNEELIALTDLVMREQHGLVEDCPFDCLVAGRGGQRAIIVEVEFQVGRQQTCNVKSGHQGFLSWEKKCDGSETGTDPLEDKSMNIMGSLALHVPLQLLGKEQFVCPVEAGESRWAACCSLALLSSWFLCWAAASETKHEMGQGLTYFLDFGQMLEYFMVVLVLLMPNLQHRDPR